MKPRTRTLGAIGATVVTAGLVIGLSFAGSSVASGTDQTTPTTVSMPMNQMSDMGSADMSATHSMMHQMMRGTVDDEVLAQCDKAHDAMTGSATSTPDQTQTQHEAHHGGTGS